MVKKRQLLFHYFCFDVVGVFFFEGLAGVAEVVLDEVQAGEAGEAGEADAEEGNAEEDAQGFVDGVGDEGTPDAESNDHQTEEEHEPPAFGTGAVVFDGVEGEVDAFEEDEDAEEDGDDFGVEDDEGAEGHHQQGGGDAHGLEAVSGGFVFEEEEHDAGDDDDDAGDACKVFHGVRWEAEAYDTEGGEENSTDDEAYFATFKHGFYWV